MSRGTIEKDLVPRQTAEDGVESKRAATIFYGWMAGLGLATGLVFGLFQWDALAFEKGNVLTALSLRLALAFVVWGVVGALVYLRWWRQAPDA